MALSSDLINKDFPYVHSVYSRYQRNRGEQGLGTSSRKSDMIFARKISQMKTIRDQLEAEAKDFLGGKTPSEIMNQTDKDYSEFIKISLEVLRSPAFYSELKGLVVYDQDTINRITMETLNKQIQASSEMTAEEVRKALNEQFDKASLKGKALKDIFKNVNWDEIESRTEQGLRDKTIKGIGKEGYFNTVLKDLLRNYGETPDIANKTWTIFEKHFNQRWDESNTIIINGESNKNKYLKTIKSQWKTLINGKYGSSGLVGLGSEEMLKAIYPEGNNSLVIEVGGALSEEDFRKNLQKIEGQFPTSIKNDQKMSYSDLLMSHNNKTVRVQSKNYNTVLSVFNSKQGKDTSQDILQQMHMLDLGRKNSVPEFFQRLKEASDNGTNIGLTDDAEAIFAYSIANEYWFSHFGSMEGGITGNVYKTQMHQETFESQLNLLFLNAIGVILDDNYVVNPTISNIFYLVDNSFLVPTYSIVDEMIKKLEDFKSTVQGVSMHFTFSGTPKYPRASYFYAAKARAAFLSHTTLSPDSMTGNNKIVEVGQSQGEDILKKIKIKSINLDLSIEKMMTSSYNFTI